MCLMSTVTDDVASVIIAQLLHLQSENPKKVINMYINSPGGSVTAGFAIYDTMQYLSVPISTWCVGQACSMGALLLAAGSPTMRVALPHSRIMIHQPSGSVGGQATDIAIHAEEIVKVKNTCNEILARHTGQSVEHIKTCVERDRFMSAKEALDFGIIDKIAVNEYNINNTT